MTAIDPEVCLHTNPPSAQVTQISRPLRHECPLSRLVRRTAATRTKGKFKRAHAGGNALVAPLRSLTTRRSSPADVAGTSSRIVWRAASSRLKTHRYRQLCIVSPTKRFASTSNAHRRRLDVCHGFLNVAVLPQGVTELRRR